MDQRPEKKDFPVAGYGDLGLEEIVLLLELLDRDRPGEVLVGGGEGAVGQGVRKVGKIFVIQQAQRAQTILGERSGHDQMGRLRGGPKLRRRRLEQGDHDHPDDRQSDDRLQEDEAPPLPVSVQWRLPSKDRW